MNNIVVSELSWENPEKSISGDRHSCGNELNIQSLTRANSHDVHGNADAHVCHGYMIHYFRRARCRKYVNAGEHQRGCA